MKTFTKRILSFALALIMTAMCFAGMTVVVIAEGETLPIPPPDIITPEILYVSTLIPMRI